MRYQASFSQGWIHWCLVMGLSMRFSLSFITSIAPISRSFAEIRMFLRLKSGRAEVWRQMHRCHHVHPLPWEMELQAPRARWAETAPPSFPRLLPSLMLVLTACTCPTDEPL